MAFECMDDCIHLKACRRVQKIGKSKRLIVPRYCTEDCSAYETAEEIEMVSPEDALYVARDGARMIRDGYDEYDTYAIQDFPTETVYRFTRKEDAYEG